MVGTCHHGGRPRFLATPPLTLNLPLMASKETLEQVKDLLKQELSPINAKLDGLTTKLSDIDTAVNFLSGKYDSLLNQLKDTKRKVNRKGLPSSLKKLSVYAFPKYIKHYLLSEKKRNQFST